ncbi:bifunctional UDP-N-acetylmuramoyl-tripeptide:D-alanyl-D-alanine ligase/alanine racemase [Dyadobacter tibetensis]|uniref:bifunctional UDP-N-acetylmuramoyl-tripeptide:D-alanyl-D-alanine ligase/alanine racemase n=1 Tax=Dyadobacter tibetensis TaxID=1211851 RepID=UPI00047079B8|nr:bifunctional UDP-N-acetylmuramoyl-tripeptide:D-alanyl-D-alanine ligase/alanine racemase [Dyadobacter tibetensis]
MIEPTTAAIKSSAKYILTDSRQLSFPDQSIFFCIKGERHDGHQFISELYHKGVREFVIESGSLDENLENRILKLSDAQFWVVTSSIRTLQMTVAMHRRNFNIDVVGIVGSNGKTIVKEWLSQLMAPGEQVIASPKSYNSQIGVPLSVWNMKQSHTLAIFEAGISKAHEMEYLQPVIAPTIGLFTNIGSAHDDGFRSRKQKITEKLRLFTKVKKLIYRKDYQEIDEEIELILRPVNPFLRTISWGSALSGADVQVVFSPQKDKTFIALTGQFGICRFETAFRDEASLENLTHCIIFMLEQGLQPLDIQQRIQFLRPVSMRLELKEGINRCYIIDDAYNNDMQGIAMALGFLTQQEQRNEKTVILSDILHSGQLPADLYQTMAQILKEKNIDRFIGIGPEMMKQQTYFDLPRQDFYPDTDLFLKSFPFGSLTDNLILIKGARPFSFEKIVHRLQQKVHDTVLEINLDALTHNLNYYRNKAGKGVRIMAMVKAFAYGSGSTEVASLLQYHRVDYLGVAYADEGVALRQSGITIPIMVLNASPATFDMLWEYNLEPEIYSEKIMQEWIHYAGMRNEPTLMPLVHLKLDTGMHRLGFVAEELGWLETTLAEYPYIRVASVFSHLVGADEGEHNAFSIQQYDRFKAGAEKIEAILGYPVIKHLLNSAGIVRFPEYRLDMVRLGIGLYGVEATGQEQSQLQTVGRLKTVVSQVKHLLAGETVGYGRKGRLDKNASIATIAIGYADGYNRQLGNGNGQVWINGHRCPTIGNICMDMTMVDVTGIPVEEGNEVIIFGKEITISELAQKTQTIPYEILTGIGSRVKRIFYKE